MCEFQCGGVMENLIFRSVAGRGSVTFRGKGDQQCDFRFRAEFFRDEEFSIFLYLPFRFQEFGQQTGRDRLRDEQHIGEFFRNFVCALPVEFVVPRPFLPGEKIVDGAAAEKIQPYFSTEHRRIAGDIGFRIDNDLSVCGAVPVKMTFQNAFPDRGGIGRRFNGNRGRFGKCAFHINPADRGG